MVKKIVHVCIADDLGGAAIATKRLNDIMSSSEELDSRMLVLVKRTNSGLVDKVSFLKKWISRFSFYYDRFLLKNKDPKFSLFSLYSKLFPAIKIASLKKADVIYLHWINNGFFNYNDIRAILKLGKPVYFFCHDMWHFTGGCHLSYGCEKYIQECNSCHFFPETQKTDFANRTFKRKLKLYQDFQSQINFICPSSDWLNKAKSSALTTGCGTHFIPNILDEQKFAPTNVMLAPNDSDEVRILFGALGGKDNPYKGWSYFVESIEKLPSSITTKLKVVLFGYDFTEQEMGELPFTVESHGLITDYRKMVELYNTSHMFIFPSLQESFGQTLFESMSCGTPVVAFPVGGVCDLINHKENGYIAEKLNSQSLSDGIQYVVESENYLEIRDQCRDKIVSDFSAKIILRQHIDLIS
jgi:glycosyltransferase involved in cell wall biosynthesis